MSDALPLTSRAPTREPRVRTKYTRARAFILEFTYIICIYMCLRMSEKLDVLARGETISRLRYIDTHTRYVTRRSTRLHLTSTRKRGPRTTDDDRTYRAYASRHRPSVWATTRRYPTERRTATTRVPSRFPLRSDPSATDSSTRPIPDPSPRSHPFPSLFAAD